MDANAARYFATAQDEIDAGFIELALEITFEAALLIIVLTKFAVDAADPIWPEA